MFNMMVKVKKETIFDNVNEESGMIGHVNGLEDSTEKFAEADVENCLLLSSIVKTEDIRLNEEQENETKYCIQKIKLENTDSAQEDEDDRNPEDKSAESLEDLVKKEELIVDWTEDQYVTESSCSSKVPDFKNEICSVQETKDMSRSTTKIWLIEKSAPLNLKTGSDRIGFKGIVGRYPPTKENVLLQYFGYHKILQEASGKISSKRDAILLVVEDIKSYWSRAGIQLKAHVTIVCMIQFIINNYKTLQKTKNRGGKAKADRDIFLSDLQNTFWVVTKEREELLKNSKNDEKNNDFLYLEKVRGLKREATLGCIDNKEKKKMARKRTREEQKGRKTQPKIHISPEEEDIELYNNPNEANDHRDPDIRYYLNARTPKRSKRTKRTKRKQVVTPEICSVAVKYSWSNRELCEMAGASSSDVEPKDKTLSVNTTRRRKLEYVKKASEKIVSNELSKPSKYYILHWDGKTLKATEHSKKNQERIAVLLTTSDGDEILLGIMPLANGTAAEEHQIILSLRSEKEIPLDQIGGVVFDTTSVNTGELNGVVRRLETSLSHSILELACRHHIYELVCGASSVIVLGKPQKGKSNKTTSPYEPLFKQFSNSWKNVNQENIHIFEENTFSRTLTRHISEAKDFLFKWLDNKKTMREDYKEMAKLCLIYLGGDLPKKMSKFKFRAPGAFHHARWMSKVLYVLQIAMLKPNYVPDMEKIRSLALFYSVYYAKAWLTSIFSSDAPVQDLILLKTLEDVSSAKGLWPVAFKEIAKAALNKLKAHTWYLSERLVGLSLFSDMVDDKTKEKMRNNMERFNTKPVHTEQQSPECSSFLKKQLQDFVGPDTHRFFDLLNLKKEFLSLKASEWNSSSVYQQNKNTIKHLPVVNDAAERALGMATTMHGPTMPKNEKQLQSTFKVAHATRKSQGSITNSSERVTKHNLDAFLKHISKEFS